MSTAPVDSFSAAPLPQRPDAQRFVDSRRATVADLSASGPRRRASAAESAARALPVEISFLARYGVPAQALQYAAALARRQGVSADAALLAEGIVEEEVFYRSLADFLRVPYFGEAVEVTPASVVTAGRGYARLRDGADGVLWLFAPTGTEIFRLMSAARAAGGRPLFAVTNRSRFIEAVRRADPGDVARAAAFSAERVDPALCVRGSLRRGPLALASGAFAALGLGVLAPAKAVALPCALLLALAFLASVFLRLFACAASLAARERAAWLEDARLPVYTIVVALYDEAAVARQLARAIDRFDYPVLWSKHT